MHKYVYTENYIAKALQISPQTVSRRIHTDSFTFDEIRALKRIFAKYDLELVGEVKTKVKIKR